MGDRDTDKSYKPRQKPSRDNFRDKRDSKMEKPEKPRAAIAVVDQDDSERIAKRLARAGIASRRDAESMIAAGRIAVNGKVLESPAVNVKKTDMITVDGKPLPQAERTRLWLFHKPAGLVTTTRDPEGRPTVFDNLPSDMPRVLSVGRLDINTEGLLLLTNDGGLSRVLELPATGWLRRYRVRAHGKVTQADLDKLKDGIAIDGIFYGAIEASVEREQGSNVWLSIGLREGKNREVKNILGALGLSVTRLIRVSFGPFQLGDLEEGAVQEVRGRTLRDQLGDRLIAEANADFDAPILNPFANHAVVADKTDQASRHEDNEWVSSSSRAKRPLKTETPEERAARNAPRSKATNVWMAPGARPTKSGEVARGRRRADDDGEKREYRPRGEWKPRDGEGGERRERRPYNKSNDERGEKREYRPRGEWTPRDGEGGERRERRPYKSNDERGEKREYRPRGEWTPRDGDSGERRERRPYKSNDERGEKREYRPRGEWTPRDGEGDERRERRPYNKSNDERGDRKGGFAKKPYGEKSYGKKPTGQSRDGTSYESKPRFDKKRNDDSRFDKKRSDDSRFDKKRSDDSRSSTRSEGRSERPRSDKPYGKRPVTGAKGADRRR